MGIIVFNPTSGSSLNEIRMANRGKKLAGSVVGVVDNGKKNSDTVLQYLADLLLQKYNLKDVIYHKKVSFSHGLTESEAIMLSKKCDFVISGVGD